MSKKKTQEEFEDELKQAHPHLTVIGEYISARKPIEVKCSIHNYVYTVSAGSLLSNKYGCYYCAKEHWGVTRKRTTEQFIEELKKINDKIEVLGEYQDARTKIKVRCLTCGNVWSSEPYSLLVGNGCKECAMKYVQRLRIKSHEQFLKELKQRNPNYDKIKFLSKYKMYESPIICECLECHTVWESKPHYLMSGSACRMCKLSKGEGKVRDFLVSNNIKFIPQKEFDGLLGCGNKPLRYDFYLPDYKMLVEYQGEFHDGSVGYQTSEEFNRQKEHDKRKRVYAKENNYELLEIWYKDFDNIELILQNKLLGDKSNG